MLKPTSLLLPIRPHSLLDSRIQCVQRGDPLAVLADRQNQSTVSTLQTTIPFKRRIQRRNSTNNNLRLTGSLIPLSHRQKPDTSNKSVKYRGRHLGFHAINLRKAIELISNRGILTGRQETLPLHALFHRIDNNRSPTNHCFHVEH